MDKSLRATLANGMDLAVPDDIAALWHNWDNTQPRLISLDHLDCSESEAWAREGSPIDVWAFTEFNTHAISVYHES
jgi:hypothetical protein